MSAETDEARDAADVQVATLTAEIAELEETQAAASVEATRLDEANKNSQALSALADEIASAKNGMDEVIDGLIETQDRIFAAIDARWVAMEAMEVTLDTLRFEAETEEDDDLVDQRWAAVDLAIAQIDQANSDNEDDSRLIEEYEYNIRQVRNGFRITSAKLVAERTNAELMVAIKQEMNMNEDIAEIAAQVIKIQAKIMK